MTECNRTSWAEVMDYLKRKNEADNMWTDLYGAMTDE